MPPRKQASGGKRAASEETPREGQFLQPVRPSTARTDPNRRDSRPRHAAPDSSDATPKTPRKAAAKRAAPKSAPPAAPRSAPPAKRTPRGQTRLRAAAGEARGYANRQAFKATHGRPSVAGRAVTGAAAGGATGLTVGGPVGAGVGAAIGGVGGGVAGARAKKAYNSALRAESGVGGARRIIVIEFAVCVVIVALSPMTDAKRNEPPGAWMKRMTAVMGLFFVLGLVSAAGRGPAKAAAGFGGIVALVLAISERNLFTKLTTVFSSTTDKPAVGTGPSTAPDPAPTERYV